MILSLAIVRHFSEAAPSLPTPTLTSYPPGLWATKPRRTMCPIIPMPSGLVCTRPWNNPTASRHRLPLSISVRCNVARVQKRLTLCSAVSPKPIHLCWNRTQPHLMVCKPLSSTSTNIIYLSPLWALVRETWALRDARWSTVLGLRDLLDQAEALTDRGSEQALPTIVRLIPPQSI